MAIARGAGTEIIRSNLVEQVIDSSEELIYGVQHHIYTVLSVVVHAVAVNADNDYILMYLQGYDTRGGNTDSTLNVFKQDMSLAETFVWNDKFSFNGYEPVDFTAGVDSEAKQNAIADQGSGVRQILYISAEHGSDNFDVLCTFIDQNNA